MSLSRIWTAFILVAMLAAFISILFKPGQEHLLGNLVTGRTGDTLSVRQVSYDVLPVKVQEYLSQGETAVQWGRETVLASTGSEHRVYQLQSANGLFETAKDAVTLSIGLVGVLALFMGFMSIAEAAGGVRFLSRIIGPFFSRIFPDVPKNHPSMGHMLMNFSANLMGLDNAATPFGIKAMQSLQELNPDKERASNAQVMFMCLHASGLTLIPTAIIADRVSLGSTQPTNIFVPCMIASFAATMAALLIVSIKQGIRIFQPVILLWILGITAIIAAIITYVVSLSREGVMLFSTNLSNGLILLILLVIVLGAVYKKIAVFDAFIDGAKGGFDTALRILPYLVGLLAAISLLRNSGAFDFVMDGLKWVFAVLGGDTRIVDALPTAVIKPLSGSGARAMMIDTLKTHGPDSFVGNLASVFRGSADTTFYIIAVYFGSISVKNTRYSVGTMLLADLVGIITAIGVGYLFFSL